MAELSGLARWLRQLLTQLKAGLGDLYGQRLEGVFLFGSHARGVSKLDSDVDLLIVLDQVEDYFAEIRRTSHLVSSLALDHDVSITCVFLASSEWREGRGPFLLNVRRDAIAA